MSEDMLIQIPCWIPGTRSMNASANHTRNPLNPRPLLLLKQHSTRSSKEVVPALHKAKRSPKERWAGIEGCSSAGSTKPIHWVEEYLRCGRPRQACQRTNRWESKKLLEWFLEFVHKNHDLQVRFKWQDKNDIGEFRVVAANYVLTVYQSHRISVACSRQLLMTIKVMEIALAIGL